MAFIKTQRASAQDFIDLKAKVKSECNRRNITGSVSAYAGANYDYTVTPAAGGKILTEHYNKNITPLNAIKPTGYTEVVSG